MKFDKKLKRLPFTEYTIEDKEDNTICVNQSIITDDRYTRNDVTCCVLTVKEFIARETETFLNLYFDEVIEGMREKENQFGVTESLIPFILGVDEIDTKEKMEEKLNIILEKRAKKYVKLHLNRLIQDRCLCINSVYETDNILLVVE